MEEPTETRICRACLALITDGHLTEIEGDPITTELSELLFIYIPEFDIKVERPCLCYDCFSTLYLFHKFKRRCLRVEEDLRLYLREKPHQTPVQLQHVLNYNKTFENNNTSASEEEEVVEEEEEESSSSSSSNDEPPSDTLELFKCKFCKRRFQTEQQFRQHLPLVHKRDKDTTCFICLEQLPSKALLNRHMRCHTGIKQCTPICGNPEDMNDIKICNICIKKFPNEQTLRSHMSIVHKKERDTTCLLCLKEMKTEKTLYMHMLIHKGEKNYKCRICAKSYLTATRLHNHLEIIHKGVKRGRTCPHCGRRINTIKQFNIHLQLHEDSNKIKYNCEQCGWVFARASALSWHTRSCNHNS